MKKLLLAIILGMCTLASAQTKVDINGNTQGVLLPSREGAPGAAGEIPGNANGTMGTTNFFDVGGFGNYAGPGGFSSNGYQGTGATAGEVNLGQGPANTPLPNSAGFEAPDAVSNAYKAVLPNSIVNGFVFSTFVSTGPTATSTISGGVVNSATFTANSSSATTQLGYPHKPSCVATGGSPTVAATCTWTMTGSYPNLIPAGITLVTGGAGYVTAPTFAMGGQEESLIVLPTAVDGYQDTTQLNAANPGLRIQACLNNTENTVCDASGEPASTLTSSVTQSSAIGQTVILPPVVTSEGTGFTWIISGNHNKIICGASTSCTLDGSSNGALGTINITGGIDDHIIGIHINGGLLNNQTGTEVLMTGAYHTMENSWVTYAGTFGIDDINCYRCRVSGNRIDQSAKAAWNVNTNLQAVSTATGSGTIATITTTANSILGPVGNTMLVLMSGCASAPYNSEFWATSTGAKTFTYNAGVALASSSTTCTYTVPSIGNIFEDNTGNDNNTLDTGDAQVGITSSGIIGGTDNTTIRNNTFSNLVFGTQSCNGNITGTIPLAVTSVIGNGTTTTVVVPVNPNLIANGTVSQVVFSGITGGGSTLNGVLESIATASSTGFTFLNAFNGTAAGTITFVVAGHGTFATGCSETYQMTDKPTATEMSGNASYNSYREAYATSGTGNRIHDNYAENCAVNVGGIGSISEAGSGCYMISMTAGGGLEAGIGTGYIGDSVFHHNTAVITGGNTSGYAFSVQAGSGAASSTFGNITVDDNIIHGGTSNFLIGLRWSDSGALGSVMTLTNVSFHDNAMIGVNSPVVFTTTTGSGCPASCVNVSGAPRSFNNGPNTPTCAPTSGGGGTGAACTVDTNSTDAAGIIILTTGSGTQSNAGTTTLTFSMPEGSTRPVCQYTLSNGGGGTGWNTRATVIDKTPSATGVNDLFGWDNNAISTIASSAYWINYSCNFK